MGWRAGRIAKGIAKGIVKGQVMSSAKGPPSGPPGRRGRRRRAPTIDLRATEIASEPAPRPPEPVFVAPVQPDPVPPAPEQPAPQPEWVEAAHVEPERREEPPVQGSGGGEPPPWSSRTGIAWFPPDFPWPLAAAGAAGALLALIAVFAVGLFSGRDGGAAPVETRLDARLGRVEQQLRELAARPSPSDPKAIEELANRLSRLETAIATPRPPATDPALANRLARLEGELRALAERDDVLLRRNDEIATIAGEARKLAQATLAALEELKKSTRADTPAIERREFEALTARMAALEKTAKAIEAQLSKRFMQDGSDRTLRLLAVATALNNAVERGRPFVSELEAAKQLADAKALAPLDSFATSGIPSTETLARELAQVLPAVAKAVGATGRDGSFLERLQANAGKIVRVRPIDDVAGDDPAAILSRVEARTAQADVAGALAELGKLPDAARAPAQAWIARARARNAAIDASRRFAADALAAVGKPSL